MNAGLEEKLEFQLVLCTSSQQLSHFACRDHFLLIAEKPRLIQVTYVTSLGYLCPKPASSEIFGYKYVDISPFFASISWPLNPGPFGCSQSIQNYSPKGEVNTVSSRLAVDKEACGKLEAEKSCFVQKSTFSQAKNMNASEGKNCHELRR